jgi:hypothetical protein
MEEDLYNKLPFGGTWWKYQYMNNDKYIQGYKKEEVNPEIKQEKILEIKKKEVNPEIKQEEVLKIKKEEVNPEKVLVWEYILSKIDDTYSIYSESMRKTAQIMLIEKLKNILTSEDGMIYFGPRKTRSIVAWLCGNKIAENSEVIIAKFISWILDEEIVTKTGNGKMKLVQVYKGWYIQIE